ncbi:hypothetical protein EJ04DRAFT_554081 [Polyplosphaeria fusca]|uniref:Uncharacterized protein n=1 Tax=Polyplosphaeria fusca TaxID=682080 RepID=A0A9P4V1M6_9PLEO|nr:hypothetical protein EJ04DRAFT_554081 [Polyplosphaeria fusca]
MLQQPALGRGGQKQGWWGRGGTAADPYGGKCDEDRCDEDDGRVWWWARAGCTCDGSGRDQTVQLTLTSEDDANWSGPGELGCTSPRDVEPWPREEKSTAIDHLHPLDVVLARPAHRARSLRPPRPASELTGGPPCALCSVLICSSDPASARVNPRTAPSHHHTTIARRSSLSQLLLASCTLWLLQHPSSCATPRCVVSRPADGLHCAAFEFSSSRSEQAEPRRDCVVNRAYRDRGPLSTLCKAAASASSIAIRVTLRRCELAGSRTVQAQARPRPPTSNRVAATLSAARATRQIPPLPLPWLV